MQTKSDFILPLSDPSASLSQVGGKGALLARLVAAGQPVPDARLMLTHSSIVAREYVFPAMMTNGSATRHIHMDK